MPRIPNGRPRGPRPRGPKAATERVTVRFSPAEMDTIRDAAEHYGQPVALYVADAALMKALHRKNPSGK